jgi:hypothetical protein
MSNPQQTQPLDPRVDGHHRVSVAKARGALTITALVG